MRENRFKITSFGGQPVNYTAFKFSGGEIQVRVTDTNWKYDIISKPLFITADLTDADSIMELILLVDSLRRMSPDVKLHLTCPYLPYARQDRVCADGEALAVRIMTDVINSLNFETVEIWDAHSDVSLALINRVKNIGPEKFLGNIINNLNPVVLVAPDAGAVKKVSKVAKTFDISMITASKIRNPQNGEITGTEIYIPNELISHKFLIVDDLCDYGGTFVALAKVIKEISPSSEIELYVTHCIAPKIEKLMENITTIYSANFFPNVTVDGTFLKHI